MGTNIKISVIIPVYNVEKYLRRCVDSVLSQTYEKLEIILVDDGSPDNCPKICDEYAIQDKRIKVIHKKNGGLSDARNAALQIMTGEYCFFLDSDDFIHKNTIRYLLDLALTDNADIVQCDRCIGGDDRFLVEPDFIKNKIRKYDNVTIFESSDNKVTIWGKLYLSSLWNGVLMPVGKLNEDDFTTWKLYYKAKSIVVTDLKLYYYYSNPDGICSNLKKKPNISYPIEAYNERIDYFDNIGEIYLSVLSKWRYIKCLLLIFRNDGLTESEVNLLDKEFKKIYKDVMRCHVVPITHKILIVMSLLNHRLTSKIISKFINV